MSERPSLAREATALLAEARLPQQAPSDAARAAAIDAIADEIVLSARRRRLARVAAMMALAAAVVIGFVALRRAQSSPRDARRAEPVRVVSGAATLHRGGTVFAIGRPDAEHQQNIGAEPREGDRIVTAPLGRIELALPRGSHVVVRAATDLGLAGLERTQVLVLQGGSARFDVEKLSGGERFLVRTPDAEIEVRGTSFVVAIGDVSCGSTTSVVVDEGTVAVRTKTGETLVRAGSSWPTCAPISSAPISSAPIPSVPIPSVYAGTTSSAAPPVKPSDLAAQNELFASGIVAKKKGDSAGAVAAFDLYLAKYPRGSLAEAAEVERMRLLTGPARVAAAKAYLARHPKGVARGEAEAVVGSAP